MLGSRTSASNSISDGDGEVHCSFDSDEEGFSRMILFARNLTAERKGRQVLRLIELETYRMLALLGLPVVRNNMGRLHKIETQLAQVTQRMTAQINGAGKDVEALLPELSSLAAQSEEMSANTSLPAICNQGLSGYFSGPIRAAKYPPTGWASGAVRLS